MASKKTKKRSMKKKGAKTLRPKQLSNAAGAGIFSRSLSSQLHSPFSAFLPPRRDPVIGNPINPQRLSPNPATATSQLRSLGNPNPIPTPIAQQFGTAGPATPPKDRNPFGEPMAPNTGISSSMAHPLGPTRPPGWPGT
jgi:hypothetical protein